MELKKFKMKRKLVSVRQKVSKLFRLIGILGNKDSDVSSPSPTFTNLPVKQVEAPLYWHEVRTAEALLNWQKWMDRPK